MKLRKYGMLALSLGLALTVMAPALAEADRVQTERTRVERGSNAGQSGYWLEYTTKTYRYTESSEVTSVRNAFQAAMGRQPNLTELNTYLHLSRGGGFDEATYLRQNPDVAAAVARGQIRSGYDHYLNWGFGEGRATGVPTGTPLNIDPSILAQAAVKVANGSLNVYTAKSQLQTLSNLAQQNRNDSYLSVLPQAYLNWDPTDGIINNNLAAAVGALGQGWEPRFADAYKGLGIDSNTKTFISGPLKGQKLASDYATALSQLSSNGYLTMDWNWDTLLSDIGGQGTLDNYAAARGGNINSALWTANIFAKQSMSDKTFIQRYSDELISAYEKMRNGQIRSWPGDVWTSWYYDTGWYNSERNKGRTPEQIEDEMVRYWMSVDGVGRFSTGAVMGPIGPTYVGNGMDADILALQNFSSAAKLVAESKALRALGLAPQAEAKLIQARNLILLDGNNHDPLVLDLNENGKIDVTGLSSAKYRNAANRKFVKDGAVTFDLLANGKPIEVEWIKGGDGFLVDNSKNAVINTIKSGKNLTGAHLFGDTEGYPGGFLKLASFFDKETRLASTNAKLSKGFGILQGKELDRLMVWVDNGDGVAKLDELKTLPEVGITEIGVIPTVKKESGEMLEQAYFVRNGQKRIMQEVWFMGK